jgi:peptidoglycan-associated lipoprotein
MWPRDWECFRQQTIHFNTGTSLLRKEDIQHITKVADFLKANPSVALLIEGHCDDRGSEEHNRWLGDRRARAVAKELVRVGVAEDRIDTVTYGKDRPVVSEHSADARQKNRRAEFVLLTPPKP